MYQVMKYFLPFTFLFLSVFATAQFNLVWEAHHNGIGDRTDRLLDMITDNSGNVYATGYTYNRANEHDLLVVKFSPTGVILWSDVYQGEANDDDEGVQIQLDNTGDVIVVGTSNNDFITIKYNTAGTRQWLQLFDGKNMDEDEASLLAIDSNNNIYVVGESEVAPSDTEITLVKYDPSGTFLFEKNFTSSGTRSDRPYDLVIDSNDRIYIAGRYSIGLDYEGVVVAYNSSGNIQWTSNINNNLGDDRFSDLHLMGNDLYAVGRNFNATNDDLLIRKINTANGTTVWDKSYDSAEDDRPEAITGDATQIWIAARSRVASQTYFNMRTLKLAASDGTIEENITYGINDARPRDIIMQGQDVYVGGYHQIGQQRDLVLIKYNSAGTQQWLKSFAGTGDHTDEISALAISNDSKLLAIGRGANGANQEDAMLIKYDLAGNLEFNEFYTGIGDNRDVINDMTVDRQDNIIQVGYTYEKDRRKNFMVVKTDANGNFMWMDTIGTDGNERDEAVAVTTDPANNIYVTGFLNNDIQTIVYEPSGAIKWSKVYNHWAMEEDKPTDILVNSSFETYVLGYSDIDSTGVRDNEILLLKYDPSGNLLWIEYQTHPKDDEGFEIAFDANENIYIAGKASTDTLDFDAVVYKITPAGNLDWVYFDGEAENDRFTNIAVHNGKVYAGGRFKSVADGDDAILQCLDLSGNLQWENSVSAGYDEVVHELNIADNGNAVIACRSDDTASIRNSVLVSYNSSGNELWRHDLNTDIKNHINALAIDNVDTILYTAGAIKTTGTDDSFVVNSYHLVNGISRATVTFKASQTGDNEAIGIAHSQTSPNRFYVGGIGYYDADHEDFTVLCYDYLPVGVEDLPQSTVRLYPNLITQGVATQISTDGLEGSPYHFALYDPSGRLVLQQEGAAAVLQLPALQTAGIYVFNITQHGKTHEGRLMVQ